MSGNIADTSDKYILLYLDSVTNRETLPELGKLHKLFSSTTQKEFLETIETAMASADRNMFMMLLYFIIIFRDMDIVKNTLNDSATSIEIIEKLVMFALGHCHLQGYTTERILDEILNFVSEEKLLELILNSKHISRDKLLLFFILTKLDNNALNKFFMKQTDLTSFIESFLRLPDEIMRSIINRNYRLFQYLMVMMSEEISLNENLKIFYSKYKADIEQLSQLGDVIRSYKSKVNLDSEKVMPFNSRDMSRISFLVNKIRSLPEPYKAIEYFDGEGMFADKAEKNIVYEVVTNPVFKNTFHNYDSVFSGI
jgi:hypothetical protein